ncbi:MAG: TIGR00730 family Rossman fold protein [Alphaproteobacteria bacterium]|mgnify:CR=1 FL=1|nr:TIGR00730 family Rossman fold protein [Alphaproteobacteria bacterium]HCP01845.1 TIGR00730 family Rossman fold protein [Rhodospirillaceae bacterium]
MTNRATLKSICVYCGSSDSGPETHREIAREFGSELAKRNIRLIYGGGRAGVMGAIADAVLAGGGEVIGIIPDFLLERENGHSGLTRLEVVPNMHVRKARMAELADAFVVLPGGLGTLEELFEIVTWRQLGLHDKAVVAVNTDGHWDHLQGLIDRLVTSGYARPENASLLSVVPDVQSALAVLGVSRDDGTFPDTGRP